MSDEDGKLPAVARDPVRLAISALLLHAWVPRITPVIELCGSPERATAAAVDVALALTDALLARFPGLFEP